MALVVFFCKERAMIGNSFVSDKVLDAVLTSFGSKAKELERFNGETKTARMMVLEIDGVRYLVQCRKYPENQP